LGLLGTAGVVSSQDKNGGLPTRNWASGTFEGAEAISGQRMADTILKERDTCFGCVVRCKRVVEVAEGPFPVDPRYGGPEYETLATMGSYCGVKDLAAICYANQLCNMYGADTIACGAISGFHGLVSSGTTSKQIACMTDARPIGYGGMLGEGTLGLLAVLAATAGFATTADWWSHYESWGAASGLSMKLAAFVNGGAAFIASYAMSVSGV